MIYTVLKFVFAKLGKILEKPVGIHFFLVHKGLGWIRAPAAEARALKMIKMIK